MIWQTKPEMQGIDGSVQVYEASLQPYSHANTQSLK